MKAFSTYRVNAPTTVSGHSISITTTLYGTAEEIEYIRKNCEELIGNGLSQEYDSPLVSRYSIEKPFITECRDTAIKKNLPLYFVYYEKTGVFEVYVTETKELFEKRHCSKHLSNYEFNEIVTQYLDDYSDWKGCAEWMEK